MLFNSNIFLFVFLPITVLGFYFIKTKLRYNLAILWIVIASLIYYGWFKAEYLLLIGFSIIFNYIVGRYLTNKYRESRKKVFILITGITINVLLLAYFKYHNFIIGNINQLLDTHIAFSKILLPIGISFFTFQNIAYLIDAYRGEAEEYSFLHFTLFVTFFPQLIAGPIVHHKELIPQFKKISNLQINSVDVCVGLSMLTIGLFKKIVIADNLVRWVDPVFSAAYQGWPLTFLEAWSGVLAFTFQIYFDFSAYSDMALGLALIFGIRLPLNFDSPYRANNIIEFWRRWHMTLSRFLRDYIYFPLGGNRMGRVRRHLNLLITMLIGGLWHGAAWTFVVWGGLHGLYLVVNHGWRHFHGDLSVKLKDIMAWRIFCRVFTFIVIVIAWVFFRAEDFSSAILLLKGMAGMNGFSLPTGYYEKLGFLGDVLANMGVNYNEIVGAYWKGKEQTLILFLLLGVVWFLPNTQQYFAKYQPSIQPVRPIRFFSFIRDPHKYNLPGVISYVRTVFSFTPSLVSGVFFAVSLLSIVLYQSFKIAELKPFIYFQF